MKANNSDGLHRRLAGVYVLAGLLTLVLSSHDLSLISGALLVGAGLLAWLSHGDTQRPAHQKAAAGRRAPVVYPSKHRL